MEKWSEKEINEAIDLLKNKRSYKEISVKLNRTYGSVRLKLQKLGYKSSDENKEIRKCLCCDKEFETTLLNEKKFCNNSCSAIYNNKLRKPLTTCLNCGCEIDSWRKHCSKKCAAEYKRNETFKLIESGNTSFSEKTYKLFLINKYGEKCMECGWARKHPTTNKVPIQIEHIDGNADNNNLNNLKLLCPNCHSLTSTYGALNKNGRDSRRNKKRQEWRNKLNMQPEVNSKT